MPADISIEWINHAGFILRMGGRSVAVDPWVDGLAFDDSWALVSPSAPHHGRLEGVSDIWLSHEHPDHFSIRSLRGVSPEVKRDARLWFQRTRDKRVLSACRKFGFADAREVDPEWIRLGPDLSMFCMPFGEGDSWAAFRDGDRTILDLNDCICLDEASLAQIAAIVGPVTVLFTQFSYASWWGNPGDHEAWRVAAKDQLEKIGREIQVLKPTYVVLCASFVYFCHADNWHMNRFANSARTAFDYVRGLGQAEPIILYPGETWTVGAEHDSAAAMDRYEADVRQAMAKGPLSVARPAAFAKLETAALDFMARLSRENSRLLLWRVPATRIWLSDHSAGVRLGRRGLSPSEGPFDVATTSDALLYCLENAWGGETLKIHGRFSAPPEGSADRFFRWFSIAAANMRGVRYDLGYYARKALRRLSPRGAAPPSPAA